MISTPLLIYFLLGPVTWVFLFIGMQMARVRMGRLLTWEPKLPANPPKVTILIPAKDEGLGIRRCLESVLALDYPNFDVLVINDRSRDDTGQILDDFARKDDRLQVLHIQDGELPAGWLGKCNALNLATKCLKDTQIEWFFFVDSDVTVAVDALKVSLSAAVERKYDAVSILTKLECNGVLERLLLPPLAGAWTIMHTVSLTNEDTRKNVAYANGQFFLIRRSAYQAVGGHESVKDQITEDVELMRRLKSQDFTVRFFMGAHLATTRMHSTLRQMFNGWARIYSGTANRRPWRIIGAILFVLFNIFTVYPAIIWGVHRIATDGSTAWLIASIAHFVSMTTFVGLIYHWSGNRARYALLLPLSGATMLAIFFYSLRKCQTGRISWRGTEFSAA